MLKELYAMATLSKAKKHERVSWLFRIERHCIWLCGWALCRTQFMLNLKFCTTLHIQRTNPLAQFQLVFYQWFYLLVSWAPLGAYSIDSLYPKKNALFSILLSCLSFSFKYLTIGFLFLTYTRAHANGHLESTVVYAIQACNGRGCIWLNLNNVFHFSFYSVRFTKPKSKFC